MIVCWQVSRIVDSHARGCQNSFLSNTQDVLNLLIGSVLEDEQNEESLMLHDGGAFQAKSWQMMNGKVIDVWKSRLEAWSQAKYMSSQTQFFCTGPVASEVF